MIAGAASRSLIAGTDFGDNILKGLPDTIWQTVGAEYEDAVQQDGKDILNARLSDGTGPMTLRSCNSRRS